jgi:hypothetical protein
MGNGAFFCKLFRWEIRENPWLYWWIGVAAVSAISMLVSFFVPLNFIALIVFAVSGSLGIWVLYREYTDKKLQAGQAEKILFICFAVIYICFLMSRLAYREWPGVAYDTDLYHAQAIRWLNEYGTVPGLGNLHARLAFNSSWLSLSALLDNGAWDNRSEWLMPALAWSGAFLYFLHELIFNRQNGVRIYSLCICAWLVYSILNITPSLYYDNPVHIVNAIVVLETYCFLKTPINNFSKTNTNTLSCILFLCISAFMIKPIAAISVLIVGLFSMFCLIRNKQPVCAWLKIYVPAFCILMIWVVRNIFLSGYILYPMPLFALPLDWAMSYEAVKSNYDAVIGWARMPGEMAGKSLENGFLFWFKPWIIRNLYSRSLSTINFLIGGVLPSIFAVLFWTLVFRYEKIKKQILFFFIWSAACIVYWFVSAPDMRFGGGFFWVFLGLSLIFCVPSKPQFDISVLWRYKKVRELFCYGLVLCFVCSVGIGALSSKRSLVGIGTIPSMSVEAYIVDSPNPFTVWIPADERGNDRTGNSPLPSTPYKITDIEMRKSGDLGEGFRYIGAK